MLWIYFVRGRKDYLDKDQISRESRNDRQLECEDKYSQGRCSDSEIYEVPETLP